MRNVYTNYLHTNMFLVMLRSGFMHSRSRIRAHAFKHYRFFRRVLKVTKHHSQKLVGLLNLYFAYVMHQVQPSQGFLNPGDFLVCLLVYRIIFQSYALKKINIYNLNIICVMLCLTFKRFLVCLKFVEYCLSFPENKIKFGKSDDLIYSIEQTKCSFISTQ